MSTDLIERLEEAALDLHKAAWESHWPDAGLGSNLATEAAEALTTQSAEIKKLREALQNFLDIEDESGMYVRGHMGSDLVIALDKARAALSRGQQNVD